MSWLDDADEDDEPAFDESHVRVRPNPKANRPRTKRRPAHEDAVVCRVLGVDRGRYTVLVDEDGADEHPALATRARELRRTAIVTIGRHTIRNMPTRKASVVAEVEERVVGRLLECKPQWCRVEFAGLKGWIRRAVLWGVYDGEMFD